MPLRKHQDQQWETIDHIVEEWLEKRQELLVLYYHLSKTTPFAEEQYDNDIESLTNLCQILTDYVSAGHFEVFEKISASIDRELGTKILDTTNLIMGFCNHHADGKNLSTLKQDLSLLGEQLALRMDLEDSLIKIYLAATEKDNNSEQPTIVRASKHNPG